MVNVFEGMHEVGVSVASMIFECTGFKPEKGDRLPETICTSCLQDARSALMHFAHPEGRKNKWFPAVYRL